MEDKNNLEKIFDFLHVAENLKKSIRFSECPSMPRESTAEHSWRVALMTFILADELSLDIDKFKAVKIALVHDIAESVTGDIDSRRVAKGEISKEEKRKLERDAFVKLQNLLPEKIGKEICELWEEYEHSKSKEAKFVKALDKIETLTHMYESGIDCWRFDQKDLDAPSFLAKYADNHVKNFPELKEILEILKLKLKSEYEKGNFPWKKEYDEY